MIGDDETCLMSTNDDKHKFPLLRSAAHRDKSREWVRLKAKVKPLLTSGNSGIPRLYNPDVEEKFEKIKEVIFKTKDILAHPGSLAERSSNRSAKCASNS